MTLGSQFAGWSKNLLLEAGSFAYSEIMSQCLFHSLKYRRNLVCKKNSNCLRYYICQLKRNLIPFYLIHLIDREASAFIQIAQFCNFMNESYFIKNGDAEKIDGIRPNIVTFLTGDKLGDKTAGILSYTGLLNAAAINFEQITTFYANLKKK